MVGAVADLKYGIVLTSAPATEPVTRTEAKLHCRVDHTSEDESFDRWIKTARRWAEAVTQRVFITQTWRMTLDEFPPGDCVINLARSPLISVSSIQYLAAATGTSTAMSASDYQVDASRVPGRIAPAYSTAWPSAREQFGSVSITFTAGYGSASDVPECVKDAMLLVINHLYEHREENSEIMMQRLPFGAEALLMTEFTGVY